MSVEKSLTDCFETNQVDRSLGSKKYNNRINRARVSFCQKEDKKTNRFKNEMYVDLDNFDLTRVIVAPRAASLSRSNKVDQTKESIIEYEILYKYIDCRESGDPLQSNVTVTDKLNLFCNGIGLKQNRRGVRINAYNNCNLPLDQCRPPFDKLNYVMQGIRDRVIKYIITYDPQNKDIKATESLESNIYIQMMNRGQMCKIIKLGSRSENNQNVDVPSIEGFNALLADYKYNNKNTDSYYKANFIVSFKSCVYGFPDKKISFKPYVEMMEIQYNKASCVPEINRENQIIVTDNILVL